MYFDAKLFSRRYDQAFIVLLPKLAREGLVQPQAWSVGDASAAPCLLRQAFERMRILWACELAGVTRL